MRSHLLSVLTTVCLTACAGAQTVPFAQPWFNAKAFAGLVSEPAPGQPAQLDIDFDGADGDLVRFTECAQVDAAAADRVVEAQRALVQRLRGYCQAYAQFMATAPARQSYLPQSLDAGFARDLPRGILPSSQGDEPIGRSKDIEILQSGRSGRINLRTASDDVVLTRLAQGDFDHDGVDDMLIGVGSRVRGAFGRGQALVLVTRDGAGRPVRILSSESVAP